MDRNMSRHHYCIGSQYSGKCKYKTTLLTASFREGTVLINDKKLSYLRETARQLPTWRGG